MIDLSIAVILGKILHPIGLTFSLLVIVILFGLAWVDFKHVNRMTIRLISAIAIGDVINHVAEILSIGTKDQVGTPYCLGLTVFRTFGRLFYGFTNLAICFHLYRVYVKLKKPSFKLELAIWFTMMLAIGLIMLVFHFLGMYTGKIGKRACVFGSDNRLFTRISMAFMGFFYLSTISICVFVTIVGHKNISKWMKIYAQGEVDGNDGGEEANNHRRRIAQRSFLYPLSTVITISAETIISISNAAAYPIPDLLLFMVIGNGLAGILTAIAFAIDPAIWKSIKIARTQLYNRKKGQKCNDLNDIEFNQTKNQGIHSERELDLYFHQLKDM